MRFLSGLKGKVNSMSILLTCWAKMEIKVINLLPPGTILNNNYLYHHTRSTPLFVPSLPECHTWSSSGKLSRCVHQFPSIWESFLC